jgi:peptidoglycan hydrolase-like protein with peptidoglycan-binding domain
MMTHSHEKLTNLAIIIVIALLFSINVAKAQNFMFTTPLKLGTTSGDVRELQKILNLSPDTAVSVSGIGSKGQESSYFGGLTRAAVVRFQEKYRNEILLPSGLSAGTGYVGPATLVMLNKLEQELAAPTVAVPQTSPQATIPANPPKTSPVVAAQPTLSNYISPIIPVNAPTENPNQKHLDTVIAAIDRVGKSQGFSAENLAKAKQIVVEQAATSTDLNGKFLETVRKDMSKAPQPVRDFFARIMKPIQETFVKKASAMGIDTDFGGALYFSMFCSGSLNWWLTVQPLAPSYATLLTYQTGSQLHLGYNIPVTTELLGKYNQGMGPCIQCAGPYCFTMPWQGLISPNVGSSQI